MKKNLLLTSLIFCIFLLISYFIPVNVNRDLTITNTYQNVIAAIYEGKHWTKWEPNIKSDWQHDSVSCQFVHDSIHHTLSIETSSEKIKINRVDNWKFHIESNNHFVGNELVLVVGPYIGDQPLNPDQNSKLAYAYRSNLFFKLFPFLRGHSFAEKTISALGSFLNDPIRFYGFRIDLNQGSDSLFITRKLIIRKQELYSKLPLLFDSLNSYARKNQLEAFNQNVAYHFLGNDSLEIMAGVNINKTTEGDTPFQFMEMPGKQPVAIAYYEGRFGERLPIYEVMIKFLADHQLSRMGVGFEKYVSPLPTSDSSMVKMQLIYPLRPY
ncbi:MAG: hypothetical protein JST58_13415 [Bacteroidetes bacterium]|nr:hypothetical protein [Bacteroidota bacterium]